MGERRDGEGNEWAFKHWKALVSMSQYGTEVHDLAESHAADIRRFLRIQPNAVGTWKKSRSWKCTTCRSMYLNNVQLAPRNKRRYQTRI
jgi:hypothetical protein